jgi:acyl carrier protein
VGAGELEYLGRLDQQVKLRGYRIELGEIEARLREQAGVGECVVVARADEGGEQRLVAYLVRASGSGKGALPGASELRSGLRAQLPEYLLPAAFVELEQLPLTRNGKLDRRALPAPELVVEAGVEVGERPRTAVEEVLCGVWAQVLRLEQVRITDNFFEIGGHSLLATQVISRVRHLFQVELPLRVLFEAPTVASLAERVGAAQRAALGMAVGELRAVARDGAAELPLSFAQQRLWFLDQLEPGSATYNMAAGMRVRGRLAVAVLEQALNEIVRRHEPLRTSFPARDGEPRQQIAEPGEVSGGSAGRLITVIDLSASAGEQQQALVQRLTRAEAQRPFDLSAGGLLRVKLLRLAASEHVVLVTMHHIISDGWSMQLLVRELATVYETFATGQPSLLPELTVQYADFAAWQRQSLSGQLLEVELSYWKRQLQGVSSTTTLPTDHPRSEIRTFHEGERRFELSAYLSVALKRLCREESVTLFMALLAGFKILLQRYTGNDEVVVGTNISNRNFGETEGIIGFFVNKLVLRTELFDNPTARDLLSRVREVYLSACTHQDVPFEKLAEELQLESSPLHNPLLQTMFVFEDNPLAKVTMNGLVIEEEHTNMGAARFDLLFNLSETRRGIKGTLKYNSDLFEPATIEQWLEHFQTILEHMTESPDAHIDSISLSKDESEELIFAFNDELV